MRRSCLMALLWLAPSLAPAVATAQAPEVVVLSLGGDAPAEDARAARDAVAAALTAEGTTVLPDADVSMRIPPARLEECRGAACAYAIGRELEVSTVAAVALWMGEDGPRSLNLSLILSQDRSYSASEAIGEGGLVASATTALAAARAAQRRALLVEGQVSSETRETVRQAVRDPDEENASGPTDVPREEDGSMSTPLQNERSLEEWILPSLLGVVGLALIGFSVYALLDEQCELMVETGTCLIGNGPNVGLGAVFAVTGGLSIAGAVIWLIVGGQPAQMGQIDVVLAPEGGGVQWRGRF